MSEPDEATRRCLQCWKHKPLSAFRGTTKPLVTWCWECRDLYRGGGRRETRRLGLDGEALRVSFVRHSHNPKLGRIPSSITAGHTCPDACGLKDGGCFAEFGMLGAHWRTVSRGGGLSWEAFLERVKALPAGQLWRHNTAGDLPGRGNALDVERFLELVHANQGRRGFTYTRKPLERRNELSAAVLANQKGLIVNLTAHGLADLDRVAERVTFGTERVVPLVVVVPDDSPGWQVSPGGVKVVTCPNELDPKVTCESCQLCSRPTRKVAVGFLAHGQWKDRVNQLVQLRKRVDA
jgi:hypothetical protein